jgi:trafficking protein particle complex subunit 8
MYFLRKAHDLYRNRPRKVLSLSFWESEGVSPFDAQGIDAIMLGIEHPLGIPFCVLSVYHC